MSEYKAIKKRAAIVFAVLFFIILWFLCKHTD